MRSFMITTSVLVALTLPTSGCDDLGGAFGVSLGVEGCLGEGNLSWCWDVQYSEGLDGLKYCDGTGTYAYDWCAGPSALPGAFELVIAPIEEVDGFALEIWSDNGDANWQAIEADRFYQQPDGSWWFSTPSAPPRGILRIRGVQWVQTAYGSNEDPVACPEAPVAQGYAYNNGYPVYLEAAYDDALGCHWYIDVGEML